MCEQHGAVCEIQPTDARRVRDRPLDSTISLERTVHLLLYLPSQDVTPLVILDRNAEPLSPPGTCAAVCPMVSDGVTSHTTNP
jgi:hypothetical protein